jgi:hypothetical protein
MKNDVGQFVLNSIQCSCGRKWSVENNTLTATEPAQRQWVGLTQNEMDDITCGMVKSWVIEQLARTIEAKLKEKNA